MDKYTSLVVFAEMIVEMNDRITNQANELSIDRERNGELRKLLQATQINLAEALSANEKERATRVATEVAFGKFKEQHDIMYAELAQVRGDLEAKCVELERVRAERDDRAVGAATLDILQSSLKHDIDDFRTLLTDTFVTKRGAVYEPCTPTRREARELKLSLVAIKKERATRMAAKVATPKE
jgi:hypothetical protein